MSVYSTFQFHIICSKTDATTNRQSCQNLRSPRDAIFDPFVIHLELVQWVCNLFVEQITGPSVQDFNFKPFALKPTQPSTSKVAKMLKHCEI